MYRHLKVQLYKASSESLIIYNLKDQTTSARVV